MVRPDDSQSVAPMSVEDVPGRLCDLLTEQIVCARQGNMGQVEQLGAQVSAIIAAQEPDPGGRSAMAGPRWIRLQQLYKELTLVLQAQRADAQTELKQLRRVKRVVGVYNRKKQW